MFVTKIESLDKGIPNAKHPFMCGFICLQYMYYKEVPKRTNRQSYYLNDGARVCHIGLPNHHDDVIKWKHFPRYWPSVRGIHRSPVNSPHKGQWRGALMFSLICVWINGSVNNCETGDLRRYRAYYDISVIMTVFCTGCMEINNSYKQTVVNTARIKFMIVLSLLSARVLSLKCTEDIHSLAFPTWPIIQKAHALLNTHPNSTSIWWTCWRSWRHARLNIVIQKKTSNCLSLCPILTSCGCIYCVPPGYSRYREERW